MKSLIAVLIVFTIICFPIFTNDEITQKSLPKIMQMKKVHNTQKIIIKDVTAYCGKQRIANTRYNNGWSRVGIVAASRSIPFGTRIRINGKVYVVQDRLALRYDHRIDIYFENYAEVEKWGKRRLKIEIIRR